MRDEVRTRWHDLAHCLAQGHVLVSQDKRGVLTLPHLAHGFEPDYLRGWVEKMPRLPHYYFEQNSLDLISGRSATASIQAMQAMGLARLPHRECVVEFTCPVSRREEGINGMRYFVICQERTIPEIPGERMRHPYQCTVMMLYEPSSDGKVWEKIRRRMAEGAVPRWGGSGIPSAWLMAPEYAILLDCVPAGTVDATGREMQEDGIHYALVNAHWISERAFPDGVSAVHDTRTATEVGYAAGVAVQGLLMLMHTQGLERLPVTPTRLNQARERRGRVKIPDHTVVRVSHVYDRSGRATAVGDGVGRASPRMHVRAAHVKRYWVGPKGAQRQEPRFIEATIVNYIEGDDAPVPRPKVVRS